MPTPQVVIDTNVLIAAQRSKRGASSKLMSLIGANRFDIHVSVPLVFEYEATLLQHREQLELTPEDVADVVDALWASIMGSATFGHPRQLPHAFIGSK